MSSYRITNTSVRHVESKAGSIAVLQRLSILLFSAFYKYTDAKL